jgi:hypothetical protein
MTFEKNSSCAPSLTEEKPQNSWEWYFLMQHFGAATRLLDWTDGALIALYFAVKGNPGYFDAAVWILDPWWLNKRIIGRSEVIPPGASGLWKKDEKRYARWLRDRFDSKSRIPKWPVAIFPTHFARRISTQRSCFTIHGYHGNGLEVLGRKSKARLALGPGQKTSTSSQRPGAESAVRRFARITGMRGSGRASPRSRCCPWDDDPDRMVRRRPFQLARRRNGSSGLRKRREGFPQRPSRQDRRGNYMLRMRLRKGRRCARLAVMSELPDAQRRVRRAIRTANCADAKGAKAPAL